tara:strand:+ start:203 stop:994 length:792 start_codon:yes stop_codon:yes gene_type:complete
MNRYELKDIDCILAMSGGMDCIALLHWLLENNRKPYIFIHQLKNNKIYNDYLQHQLDKIRKYYNVPIVNWNYEAESNTNGFADRERTLEHKAKLMNENDFDDAFNRKNIVQAGVPGIISWSMLASMINAMHPWVSEIYWGMCYGGLVERNDMKGDKLWDYNQQGDLVVRNTTLTEPLDKSNYDDRHKNLFNGQISTLKSIGIETNFISPIGYMTKKELYEMLPQEVREMVITCSHPWKFNFNECGKCNKCKDLIAVKKACEEW